VARGGQDWRVRGTEGELTDRPLMDEVVRLAEGCPLSMEVCLMRRGD